MHRLPPLALAFLVALPATAWAGMPFYRLSEPAAWRVRAISFFAIALLAISTVVWRLWNSLAADFRLPRLRFLHGLALVFLWGLLFHVVLAMISGARELITPGAWERSGAAYKLSATASGTKDERLEIARRDRLQVLRTAIWDWSAAHGGALPPHAFVAGIPAEAWETLDPSRSRYVYVAGRKRVDESLPLAYEPSIFGRTRFVLTVGGEIQSVPATELAER